MPKVSRTFAINIRILKGDVYRGVLLAYLLCRIADTLEDDHYFPVDFKIQKLHDYSSLFPPALHYQEHIGEFLHSMRFTYETPASQLVNNTVRVFNELVKLPDTLVAVISRYVKEMAIGMATFLQKGLNKRKVVFENQNELDQYCYYVAGTVGLMLTSLFTLNSKKIPPEVKMRLEQRSVPFGLGLQVTNIVKDFVEDQKRGWCYVPRSFFTEAGIDPSDDLLAEKPDRLRKVERRIIEHALGYLDEAFRYIMDIPRTFIRYRLFCLWPLFMAVETLAKLYHEHSFVNDRAIKITRDDVKRITRNTSLLVLSNSALRFSYNKLRPVIL
ncbi:MAG TPA: phytoene/squalene synthase family protein [Thermodesulfobacteriota bacterium]|nr:phytoene/squalene synthase family protein [Thermodesulfobacteriota bacterium]